MIVLVIGVYNLNTDCDFDRRVIWAAIIYLASHIVLFSNFYFNSYVKPRGKAEDKNGTKSEALENRTKKDL